MPGEAGKAPPPGRKMPTVAETLLWAQRIEKEELINARSVPQFSVRHAVAVVDVPARFKPGHVDPVKDDKGLQHFDPAENGWDPQGPEAREFRRFLAGQHAGPRDRQAFPMTSAQEMGWVLAPHGEPADRVRRRKNRMGLGWECKHPSEWSESTAIPPPFPAADGDAPLPRRDRGAGSQLSAVPPAPPALQEGDFGTEGARGSQVSAVAPTQLSRASAASVSELSRATSLPAIRANPIERLRFREERLDRAMAESARYLSRGDRGSLYARPLGMTDATKFDDDFVKANSGVPLYKTVGSQEVVLKDVHKNVLAPKWR